MSTRARLDSNPAKHKVSLETAGESVQLSIMKNRYAPGSRYNFDDDDLHVEMLGEFAITLEDWQCFSQVQRNR